MIEPKPIATTVEAFMEFMPGDDPYTHHETRRVFIDGYTMSVRGEDNTHLSSRNREFLNERYPEWETRLDAAHQWEQMWGRE